MKRKIIFFDIDGTLVDIRDRTLPDSAVRAIRQAREAGHLVCINSGRPWVGIDPGVKDIGFDGFVCSCGCYVRCGDEVMFHQRLDRDVQLRMVELVREYGYQVLYEGAFHVYFDLSRPLRPHLIAEKAYYEKMGLDTEGDPGAPDAEFDKFVVWTGGDRNAAQFKEETAPWFQVIEREGDLLELVPHGCTKARGMDLLLERFGLTRADCAAIGDSTNDLPMLEAAGVSVAMGSGDPRIFSRVSWVTDSVREDGVARALERLGVVPGAEKAGAR